MAELEQLPLDSAATPREILRRHANDEISNIIGQGRATVATFGTAPTPEQLETHAMPSDDRRRLHDHQELPPVGETAKDGCPEETIHRSQNRPRNGALEHDQLMTKHEIFGKEGLGRPKGGEGQTDNE